MCIIIIHSKTATHTLVFIMLIEEDILFGKSECEELNMLLNSLAMFTIISGDCDPVILVILLCSDASSI